MFVWDIVLKSFFNTKFWTYMQALEIWNFGFWDAGEIERGRQSDVEFVWIQSKVRLSWIPLLVLITVERDREEHKVETRFTWRIAEVANGTKKHFRDRLHADSSRDAAASETKNCSVTCIPHSVV